MKKIILIFTPFFLTAVVIYNSNSILFDSIDSMNKSIHQSLHISFVRNKFIKIMDSFNPFIGELALSSIDIPEINIKLNKSSSDMLKKSIEDSFEDLNFKGWPYMSPQNNPYVDMEFTIDNQVYGGKLRLHGTDSIHYRNKKKSFAIKLSKKKLFQNMRRFSLLVINEASISSIFSYKVSKLITGFKVNSYLVKVKINGISQGVYVLEEKLSQELLEKNKYSGVDIVRPNDEWDTQYQATHETPFNWNISNTIIDLISEKELGQLLTYKELYYSDNIELLKAKLDLNNLAKTEALRFVFNKQVVGDNQKLLYDTSTGKFFRFFRTENTLRVMSRDLVKKTSYDTSLFGVDKKYPNRLFINLIKDNQFRQLRNQELWKIYLRKDELFGIYDETFENNKASILADSNHYSNGKVLVYDDKKKMQIFRDNIRKTKEYLEYFNIQTSIVSQNEQFVVKFNNLGNVPYEIKIGKIRYILNANVDERLYPSDSVLQVELKQSPESIIFRNTVTGKQYVEQLN